VGRVAASVAVVIPNWNGAALLGPCLAAVHAQRYQDHEVVVVDNGSRDASLAVLGRFPAVRVLRLGRNRGFGAATNAGIRATSGRYVATLNNDALPGPDWLGALVTAAEADPRVGMCASRMVLASRPDTLDSCGIAVDRAGIAWDLLGGEPLGADCQLDEPFGPCAGAALYRRAMLAEIGLFDEGFFAYLEDVDLAWRARTGGWRCRYVAAAEVRHAHSATAGEGSTRKRFLLGRNKVWLLAKNYPATDLWRWLPLVVAYDLAAVGYGLAVRRDGAALRGRLAGLGGLPRALRARRAAGRRGRASARAESPAALAAAGRAPAEPAAAAVSPALQPLIWPWRVPARYRHLAALAGASSH
jgi:GT2 family glycosyltransferase